MSDSTKPYTSDSYQAMLKKFGIVCSITRKGNYWDNSPTEQFFKSLKHERLNWLNMRNSEVVRMDVVDYIDWYNSRRLHSTLGYCTPIEFKKEFLQKAA